MKEKRERRESVKKQRGRGREPTPKVGKGKMKDPSQTYFFQLIDLCFVGFNELLNGFELEASAWICRHRS